MQACLCTYLLIISWNFVWANQLFHCCTGASDEELCIIRGPGRISNNDTRPQQLRAELKAPQNYQIGHAGRAAF